MLMRVIYPQPWGCAKQVCNPHFPIIRVNPRRRADHWEISANQPNDYFALLRVSPVHSVLDGLGNHPLEE
jgi:hypothetical protein